MTAPIIRHYDRGIRDLTDALTFDETELDADIKALVPGIRPAGQLWGREAERRDEQARRNMASWCWETRDAAHRGTGGGHACTACGYQP